MQAKKEESEELHFCEICEAEFSAESLRCLVSWDLRSQCRPQKSSIDAHATHAQRTRPHWQQHVMGCDASATGQRPGSNRSIGLFLLSVFEVFPNSFVCVHCSVGAGFGLIEANANRWFGRPWTR